MVKQLIHGFTIVELIVVIAVIGILSSVTVVAYNGVQQRTVNTQTISDASKYAEILETIEISGKLTIDTARVLNTAPNRGYIVCLGDVTTLPAVSGKYSPGMCATALSYNIDPTLNTFLDTKLGAYRGAPYKSNFVTAQVGTSPIWYKRGVLFTWDEQRSPRSYITYYLHGDVSCGLNNAQKINAGTGNTACMLNIIGLEIDI